MCKVRESDHRVIVFSLKCTSKIVPVSNAEPLAFSPHLSPNTFVKITLLWTLGCNTAPISVTIAFRWRQVLNYRHFRNILYCELCFRKYGSILLSRRNDRLSWNCWGNFMQTLLYTPVLFFVVSFHLLHLKKWINNSITNSINQPASQSVSQPTNRPTYRPTDRPSDQLTNQPTNQPTSHPTNQPTNQPLNQSINQQNPTRIFHERDIIKRLCYCIKQHRDFMTKASVLPLRPN